MHLLIPFASALSSEVVQRLPDLPLPHLARLLARLDPTTRDDADPYTMSPPHERALAAACGWHGGDGRYPFAAHAARADGVAIGDHAWGLVTPAHWHVGRDQVSMADPDALALDAAESRAFFEAVRGLFEGDGCSFAWGAPERWYAAHPAFDGLATASLDRVIGRNVDLWLGSGVGASPAKAWVRRLQSEVQLLLYPHPLNEAREARGALPINSFWLSGCGRAQSFDAAREGEADVEVDAHALDNANANADAKANALPDANANAHARVRAAPPTVDATLRRPLLDGDAEAWAAAWTALDNGPLAALLQATDRGDAPVALTLCGERSWQRYERAPRSWWRRARAAAARPVAIVDVLAAL